MGEEKSGERRRKEGRGEEMRDKSFTARRKWCDGLGHKQQQRERAWRMLGLSELLPAAVDGVLQGLWLHMSAGPEAVGVTSCEEFL